MDILRHQVFSMANRQLPLSFTSIMRLTNPLLVATTTPFISGSVRLLPTVMHHAFSILQHFLPPEVEEVIRICVELQTIFTIITVWIQFAQWWRFVTLLIGF